MSGFWTALFGAIIVGLTGMLANWFIGPKGRVERFWLFGIDNFTVTSNATNPARNKFEALSLFSRAN
jgi:hypothetical protein